MTELTWKDSGINTIAKMRGKKVGNWLFGNEFELFAALVKYGMDPTKNKDVTIVQQPFDMDLFLQRKIDAASAMTYNELAQVLETKNPKTGKLYTLSDLNVIKMQSPRRHGDARGRRSSSAATGSRTHEPGDREEVPGRLVQGLDLLPRRTCRSARRSCSRTARSWHGPPAWQMNEINALIWPAPKGIGVMNPTDFARTAKISQQFKVDHEGARGRLPHRPGQGGDRDAEEAGLSTSTALKWKKATVAVTAGGK